MTLETKLVCIIVYTPPDVKRFYGPVMCDICAGGIPRCRHGSDKGVSPTGGTHKGAMAPSNTYPPFSLDHSAPNSLLFEVNIRFDRANERLDRRRKVFLFPWKKAIYSLWKASIQWKYIKCSLVFLGNGGASQNRRTQALSYVSLDGDRVIVGHHDTRLQVFFGKPSLDKRLYQPRD